VRFTGASLRLGCSRCWGTARGWLGWGALGARRTGGGLGGGTL